MTDDLKGLLKACLPIMEDSGEIIKRAWIKPDIIHHKARTDLVTETDFAVQRFLQERLSRLLPEAAFLGEEERDPQADSVNPQTDLCWIVDPVDGTTNFVHRIPFVATSVALWDKGQPLIGLVNAPMLGELFYASIKGGAFRNGDRIRVSSAEKAADALVCTGLPYVPIPEMAGIMGRLSRIIPATQGLRRLGAAALDLAYVACGCLDAFYETSLKPWDMAGGVLLVREAGGTVSDFHGQSHLFGQPLLADNGTIHELMLDLVSPRPGEE